MIKCNCIPRDGFRNTSTLHVFIVAERGSYWARLLKISRGQDDFSSIFGLPMESIKLTEAIRRQLKLPATLLQPYNLRRPHLKSFSQHAQDRLAAEIFKNQVG